MQKRADALLISADPLFTNRPVQLATLAARHAMPTIYALREFAEAGGLMSYGSNFTEKFARPAPLREGSSRGSQPICRSQAAKFELVINLKTAKALGVECRRSARDRGQGDRVKRREFVTLLGGAAVAWPHAARAQRRALPVIGFLNARYRLTDIPRRLRAFRPGASKDSEYVEGDNVAIEYRWAEGQL